VLIHLSRVIEGLFAAKDVTTLTGLFFALYFLCATQDIAVDGWALTMLRKENAGYASTCNAVGQTIGFTVGFMFPMAKVVPLPDFILFWGTVFIATTVAVWALKSEAPTAEDEQLEGLVEAYQTMYRVLKLAPVQTLGLLLFTRSLAFIPADVMAIGRLQDSGFPKEHLATIKLFITPLEIVLPWLLSRFTAGPRPLGIILVAYLPRTLLSPLGALLAYVAGDIPTPTPTSIYVAVFALTILQGVLSNAMFVSHMAFFAKVSDPAIGGTYMTFLNTVHNIGNMWTTTACLKAADQVKTLSGLDGFHVLCGACGVYGVVWYIVCRPVIQRLQEVPEKQWRVAA
jgi:PAT family acetyl-CoA transporter-like MFS transporter 1